MGMTMVVYGYDPVVKQFTGKERDTETGLDYFGDRYLSSAQGRWMSPDAPLADQHVGEPQTWGLYICARNNPLRFVDTDGHASLDYLRVKAVRLAWAQEKAMVASGRPGSVDG